MRVHEKLRPNERRSLVELLGRTKGAKYVAPSGLNGISLRGDPGALPLAITFHAVGVMKTSRDETEDVFIGKGFAL